MPLFKGKSKKSFEHNIETEMDHGKPQGQALAIAYRMKRKKMAKGGWTPEKGKKQHEELQAKRGESYGHEQKGVNSPSYSSGRDYGQSMAGDQLRYAPSYKKQEGNERAKSIQKETLSELKSMPSPKLPMADGGQVCMHCGGSMYSEGGKVANSDEINADFEPNEFDDLHLRDDLESTYTGENSGDYLGDEQEDEDRKSMVSRIMRMRKMKAGHNPRPA